MTTTLTSSFSGSRVIGLDVRIIEIMGELAGDFDILRVAIGANALVALLLYFSRSASGSKSSFKSSIKLKSSISYPTRLSSFAREAQISILTVHCRAETSSLLWSHRYPPGSPGAFTWMAQIEAVCCAQPLQMVFSKPSCRQRRSLGSGCYFTGGIASSSALARASISPATIRSVCI